MAKAESAVKKVKRSKEEIAKDKAALAERRAARERQRELDDAEAERQRLVRLQASYDAQLAYERGRASNRLFQEYGVRWLMWSATSEAIYDDANTQMFERYYRSNLTVVENFNDRARSSTDPLNIAAARSKAPLGKKEKMALERKAEEERLARGEKREIIPDLDNPRQNVMVTSLPHSFRRLKLQIHQEPAATRFVMDWESAGYAGLSSQGFDPKVDSSAKETLGHMRAAEAQKRLRMAETQIGSRNYDICVGVLIKNANPSRIHSLGGRDHRSVSHDIDVALNALAGFYDPVRLERDPTWKAFKRVIEAGQAVIKKLEDEVR